MESPGSTQGPLVTAHACKGTSLSGHHSLCLGLLGVKGHGAVRQEGDGAPWFSRCWVCHPELVPLSENKDKDRKACPWGLDGSHDPLGSKAQLGPCAQRGFAFGADAHRPGCGTVVCTEKCAGRLSEADAAETRAHVWALFLTSSSLRK